MRYVVTTPIYYPNSVPHIGTALTTVLADVMTRYRKLTGDHPFFLTGTDENGLKLKEAAEAAGEGPTAFVERISTQFREVWDGLDIRYDDFIRTTEPRHILATQRFFQLLQEKGHIFMSTYEGWYDVSSETFFKEADLIDGKSPDGNPVRWVSEDNYFFRLSAFAQPLLDHIQQNPKFLLPSGRRNEVISFIQQGLRDVCISRSNPGWGIEVPGDPSRVIYVWFDAVINYLTASGWPEGNWQDKWPASVHLMAKDIFTRFHATLWPAMLMAAELPLPKSVVGHGWLLLGGEKISKSKGNVVAPLVVGKDLAERSGATSEVAIDALRYVLAAVAPFEADTGFSLEELDRKYNSDLANDLGNALNRTLSMANRFLDGIVPEGGVDSEALEAVNTAKSEFEAAMEDFRVDKACFAAIEAIRFLNKYIDTKAPWALAKSGDDSLPRVMKSALFVLQSTEGLFRPMMPRVADEIARQLNTAPTQSWAEIGDVSRLVPGTKLQAPTPIFPRLDLGQGRDQAAPKPSSVKPAKPATVHTETMIQETAPSAPIDQITIEDFAKVQLKVARIFEAQPLEGSDKLMKLQVMIGEERRQIIAGIRKNYTPEELIGRQIVVVANLKPAVLRGADSQGMLLAAVDAEGGAILLQPEKEAPEGAKVR